MSGRGSSHPDDDALLAGLREVARAERRADEAAWKEVETRAPGPVLGAQAQDAIVARLLGGATERPKETSGGQVVALDDIRRRKRLLLALVGGPIAAAALVVLLPKLLIEETKPLPLYALETSGGVQELRGGETEVPGAHSKPLALRPESELRVTVRPAVAVEGPVEVRAFLLVGDTFEEVKPRVERAPSGAALLRGQTAELFGGRKGRYELRVVVARPELARGARVLAGARRPGGPGWQTFVVPVALE